MNRRLISALVFLVLAASCAAALSREQLNRLQQAGIDPAVIIQRLQASGIDFQPTSDVLAQLRKSGFPEAVIAAVALAKVQPNASGQLAVALRAYQQGRFADSAELLGPYMSSHPEDFRVRCLLARSQIKADQKPLALANYQLLKDSNNPNAQRYAVTLEPLLFPEKEEELRQEMLHDLSDLKGAQAIAVVDRMYLLPHQKELVKFYINESEGNLASSFMRLAAIKTATQSNPAGIAQLQSELQSNAGLFADILKRITWYRLAPLTNGACTPESARTEAVKLSFALEEYLKLIANAARLFPLNPRVLDLEFQAALLTSGYEDLEAFGDQILDAKGTLRIPFYSEDALFDLVIDGRQRRIYTEFDRSSKSNDSGDSTMSKLTPFNLGFEEVRAVSQKSQNDVVTFGLARNSYALKFEPSGLAPHYAFMHAIHCLYGEKAQKTTTYKIGKYIAHVLRNPSLQTHLVDADKTTRDWLVGTTNTVAVATIAAADVQAIRAGDASIGVQGSAGGMKILAANAKEGEKKVGIREAQSEAIAEWHKRLRLSAFSKIEEERVSELESIEKELLLETAD